jgi:hypothetical protein
MIEPKWLVEYPVWKLTEAHTKGIDKKTYGRTKEGDIVMEYNLIKKFWNYWKVLNCNRTCTLMLDEADIG